MEKKVLLIDDELSLAQNLGVFLEDYDFSVNIANNGEEGLSLTKSFKPNVVIVDLNMPIMNGYEFVRHATKLYPQLPIIVLSGVGEISDAVNAIREGAWDFISKPLLDMNIILHTIEKCLEKAQLIKENEAYKNHLEELVAKRTSELEETKKQILTCLGTAAEFKDTDTGYHVARVAQMSYIIARGLGLEKDFCLIIRDASTMHDVGKIGIEDSVLLKNGKLDDQEWDLMQQHVRLGCSILSSGRKTNIDEECSPEILLNVLNKNEGIDVLTVAKRIALFHHERWDGEGYLFGLSKEKIPIEARIVSLVDFYDAVSSKRPYKDPYPEEKCQRLIKEGEGTRFDPSVVQIFFKKLKDIHQIRYKPTY